MIKKFFNKSQGFINLRQQNRYYLLDHNFVEKTKKKMFEHNEKTLWLKFKFILKQGKYTLVQGVKDLLRDSYWMFSLYRKKPSRQFTAYQNFLVSRITVDLLKFIPYSVIIVVPFAELMLPILLWIFPNGVPSFFVFDTAQDKRIKRLEQQQQESHDILIEKLMDVLRREFKKQEEFIHYDFFKKDFFEVIDQLNVELNYNNFSSDELIHVLRFLGGNFFTGIATINKVVNLFTLNIPRFLIKLGRFIYSKITKKQLQPYEDPFFVRGNFRFLQLNYFPFQFFKRRLLLFQIKQQFKHITKEDATFQKHGMDDIQGYNIKHFTRNRGLAAISCYITLKNVLKNDWVKITTHPKFSDNTKLWYSVMMFHFMNKTNKDLN